MPHDRPFHRNYRAIKDGPNAGYSGWGYIRDKDYAKSPTHYVRAFSIIQSDLQRIFEYIEPSPESEKTYSYRIHELLMRTCIEIEANFKAILHENTYTSKSGNSCYNMTVYKKLNATHRLSSYDVILPIWNGPRKVWKPFAAWTGSGGLPWYQAYNSSKHDRHEEFKKANMESLISAVAGLLIVLSSQFGTEDFSSGSEGIVISGQAYHEMQPAIGSLFRIKFPDDWPDAEKYDFDWSVLSQQANRFQRFDYNSI
ncbi:hypothetical protein NLY43_13980 [Mesorhizobium sp. C416B]|nr:MULTISPECIES: hypothetical protein [unclassified Mesorhizobium]ESX41128.1 hypothetical protein X762_30315 [Mesorhizobium sp. LSHC426A00]ESX45422.1 hypothetical protein X761_32170 [Mesorhizobium sp. LSHC424B00]ESX64359.1 hypothetical protein X758_31795 [Mesorhizobium sp. LSHC416B00]WJI65686.1 hypothetical protein NLY43_13980 [Mesorhizobium sp. C416B]